MKSRIWINKYCCECKDESNEEEGFNNESE